MLFLTPTYKPVGGVVKIFDYVGYARALGFDAEVLCPVPFDPSLPLFQIERFASLTQDPGVTFRQGFQFGLGHGDYVFFSWPTHHEYIASRITPSLHPLQTILIVQNVRWANPQFAGGYAVRLLGRPMARVIITDEVREAIDHLLHPTTPSRVILEGHDWPYFSKARSGGLPQPIKVAYTTWKSEVGIDLEASLAGDGRFQFRSIRTTADWETLRELYHWADVFLGFPGPEEGFYLPGLEAMAAGNIVIMPDVGGNRAYGHFGENCIEVHHDVGQTYVEALEDLASWPAERAEAMRSAGYAVLESHRLAREGEEFGSFIAELDAAIGAVQPAS